MKNIKNLFDEYLFNFYNLYYRLAANNGELTITPARGGGGSPGRTPPCKLSPASTDASDLLADSPGN